MKTNKRICVNCNKKMVKSNVTYKSMDFEARKCTKCNETIFTEDLAMKAIAKLESARLEEEYVKHPIKIGNSWGVTFPKEVTKAFDLDDGKTVIKMHPNIEKGKIEISLG
jgi:NAD-dependent SIR2 family protein deacetylase